MTPERWQQIGELFDVVARVRPQVEDAEDDVGGRAELHIAYRYIIKMYLLSISGCKELLLSRPSPRPSPASAGEGEGGG